MTLPSRALALVIAALLAGPAAALALSSITNASAAGSKRAIAPTFTTASATLPSGLAGEFADLAGATVTRTGRIAVDARPLVPRNSRLLGPLAPTRQLTVMVSLKPRSAAALASFATAVSTPGDPQYRHYLTVAEFRARFGASPADLAAVRSTLARAGLVLTRSGANGLSFQATGTVAALETAFATKLERLALPGGRIAYTNTSSPTLAAGIGADVQSVIGLSNVFTPHREGLSVHRPAATHAVIGAASAAAVSSPSDSAITSCAGATAEASSATAAAVGPLPATTAYVAQQLAQSYDFEPLYAAGDEGQGVTVGIYELEPNFASDITAFQNCYGISSAIKYVETDGGAGTASASNEDGVETELDIENVMELAPKASVDVFQSPNSDADALAQYSDMITGTAGKLNVISTSWGDCEAEEGSSDQDSENTLFQEAATQGISVVAASGDDGAEDCELPTGTAIPVAAVDDPASQPFVTGAGGTSLTALGNAPATKPTEVVWNSGVLNDVLGTVELEVAGAGGGGVSETWEMPSYQSAAPASLNTINSESSGSTCSAASGDCREVPDVSADADYDTGYTVYWNGSWTVVGGTSGAAPLWAAMFADADAESVCQAHGDIGFANAALYHVAGSSTANYAGAFNDVTSGNNDLDDANGGAFAAGTGYDMASGLGSPVAGNLAPALCDAGDGLTITPTAPSPTVAASTTTTTTTSTPATSTVAKATVTGASNTTTVSQSATRTTVKGTCKLPAKLSFLQHPGPPTREIKAVLSVDGRVVRTVTGRRILDVVLTRPKATKFTLKLVTTLSSGEVVSHQLTYSGCKSSSPTVRVLHQADTGSAAKRK